MSTINVPTLPGVPVPALMRPLTFRPALAECHRRRWGRVLWRVCRLGSGLPTGSIVLLLGVTAVLSGCSDLTAGAGLPAGTPDPSFYNNANGALELHNAAILRFIGAWTSYESDSGLLTDELEDQSTGLLSPGQILQNAGQITDSLDERILPPGTTGGIGTYGLLQEVRGDANNALGALATYDTVGGSVTPAANLLRGELYALEGYAEILLADLYCSGVPLSTLDFQKDFTYHAGSTTGQVYRDAIFKFDSALTLGSASDSVVNLAKVGQGRANLDLGNFAAAADDVSSVPTSFNYTFIQATASVAALGRAALNLADNKGTNGLPFRSSGDPRSAPDTFVVLNTSASGVTIWTTKKYNESPDPFIVASGVEARLIEAEAALQANQPTTWLADLNALRTTVPGLLPIMDPVDPTARVDTMFTERAEWLWLTGHRQGDLRRLLREPYVSNPGFTQGDVYPTGTYLAEGAGEFGNSVVVPIPLTEFNNPLYQGCKQYVN